MDEVRLMMTALFSEAARLVWSFVQAIALNFIDAS